MIVRPAEAEDVPALIALGEVARRESLIPFPPIEPDRVAAFAEHFLAESTSFCVLVAEEAGDLFGMIAASLAGYPFSSEVLAQHLVFCVRPDRRASRAGVRLIDGYLDWARREGAHRAIIGVHSGLWPERTGKLFQRKGFEYMGGTYKRDL